MPYVLLPRKRVDPAVVAKYKGKFNLIWADKTWMEDELTTHYLINILGLSLFDKRLLVWDVEFFLFSKKILKK